VPRQELRGAWRANELRRAVIVARNREIGRLDLPQRRLAREQLDARLLGGEARGEAGRPSGALAAVFEFSPGKDPAQILGWRFIQQPLDPGDFYGVDAAAAGRREGVRHGECAPGAR